MNNKLKGASKNPDFVTTLCCAVLAPLSILRMSWLLRSARLVLDLVHRINQRFLN